MVQTIAQEFPSSLIFIPSSFRLIEKKQKIKAVEKRNRSPASPRKNESPLGSVCELILPFHAIDIFPLALSPVLYS